MTETLIDPQTLFDNTAVHGSCCGCCDDYCPLTESQESTKLLHGYSLPGVEYVVDQAIAVRRDVLKELPSGWRVDDGMEPQVDLYVPAEQPGVPARYPSAGITELLDRVGLVMRSNATGQSPRSELLHLYYGTPLRHVGWTMSARDQTYALDPADLPLLRELMGHGLSPRLAHTAIRRVRDGVPG